MSSQNKLEPNCGTIITSEIAKYYKSLKPLLKTYEQDFSQIKFNKRKNNKRKEVIHSIPIKAHVIRASDGSGGINTYVLNKAFKNLNSIYTDAFMSFFLYDGINYIDNDNLCHFNKDKEQSLTKTTYVSGIINIYFTDYIENASKESICGYSDTTIGKNDIIIMKNKCTTNNSSLAHELGHLFSLIHTHGPDNNKITSELVNGSNCDTDGDGICDTPADPKLSSSKIDNFCKYKGNETDSNGDIFSPDTGNIMSYSRKACRNHFSTQQLARMYAYYKSQENRFIISSEEPDTNIESKQTNELNDIKVYPNPIKNDVLFVKTNNTKDILNYKITNLVGQIFLSGNLSNQPISFKNLPYGSYLLTLESKHSKIIKKIIK
ncbi:hypothetical protein A8C32_01025 [Flavivirga aquatica]|uniref:Secretion system C-terminal sorting domain-containing protein n=1 Tax=Flavivirga aquatica TaxID=1849968 RepID=A0A1E5TC01_9FLAO|nr:zinc-dependent metalloprotease [Flavivirga aquatica]OEK08886.1 hypothetical protein A8C32_01025 [Flavivirga aquatica]